MPYIRSLLCALMVLLPVSGLTAETPADPEPANERAEPPGTGVRFNYELTERYGGTDLVELPLADEQAIGLYLQRRSSKDLGAVILVAESGQHADWPVLIAPLRKQLPEHGWHSLSLAAPMRPAPPVPPPSEGSQAEQESAREEQSVKWLEAQQRFKQQLGARVLAASEYLTNLGIQPQVLLLTGSTAEPVLGFLAEQKAPFAALVLVQVNNDEDDKLVKLLEQTPQLTLDLYYGQAYLDDSAERYAAAQRAGNSQFHRINLSGPQNSIDASNQQLIKRVSSWLQRYPGGGR
ncbi:alpha/beta hydrolase family protein [Aestuariirhabdus sp. Z084]|uniref:DUF3530 family protein n=1 Tax=Aestuariirhabdus haliotis TaxID=2918751 RepID=UPI00201B42E2|nr:DUF3530 family protein [Aestuariirhabdus haliotis]MCL6415405.1 alpha/beta hydrolase family protein [Aestuariirhabdus haliotis]MCL6419161.1 alpha/beta hydrolase family protein [Aestuariirhabdus haliotis]